MLGFALAALGLAASWKVAGTTVATLVLPILILAVPILDTALVTVVRLLEGRPIYQGGRDHASHRLVRCGLSERRAVAAARADRDRHRRLEPRLQRARQRALHARRRRAHASRCSSSSRASSPTSSGGRDDGEPGALTQAFAVHWRRVVEVLVDFALITGSFLAAYAIAFGWPGHDQPAAIAASTLPILLAARYLAFIPFGLYRSVWRYAGARDAARDRSPRSSSPRWSRSRSWR